MVTGVIVIKAVNRYTVLTEFLIVIHLLDLRKIGYIKMLHALRATEGSVTAVQLKLQKKKAVSIDKAAKKKNHQRRRLTNDS